MMKAILLVIVAMSLSLCLNGQTCCSGGVPVSSNLGMPASEVGVFQGSVNYDLNVLNTLKTGKEILADRNRRRTTHAALLELGYTFSRRWSIDALFSYVRQERNVNNFGTDQFTSTSGIGDATLLAKYRAIDKDGWQLSTGLGIKAPLGASDKANDRGIALNADLQPGSGAWDGVGWIFFNWALPSRPSSSLFLNFIYASKGHNKTYLGSQDYKFGDEFQIIGGWGDQALLFNQIFDFNLAARYRRARPDENNAFVVPSTGGSWLFINPGVAWWPSQRFSFQANVELPMLSNITGTQVTPTVRFNTGFYYQIPSSKISLDL